MNSLLFQVSWLLTGGGCSSGILCSTIHHHRDELVVRDHMVIVRVGIAKHFRHLLFGDAHVQRSDALPLFLALAILVRSLWFFASRQWKRGTHVNPMRVKIEAARAQERESALAVVLDFRKKEEERGESLRYLSSSTLSPPLPSVSNLRNILRISLGSGSSSERLGTYAQAKKPITIQHRGRKFNHSPT